MDYAAGNFIWETTATKALAPKHYSPDDQTSVDVLEVFDEAKSKVHQDLDKSGVEKWLASEGPSLPAKVRVIFINEHLTNTDDLCINPETLDRVLRQFEVSRQFASCLTKHHQPTRRTQRDSQGQVESREFWYSAVGHSTPPEHSQRVSKRILGWSRLSVWMSHGLDSGRLDLLIVRCPPNVRTKILTGPMEFHQAVAQYPMVIHLFLLRNLYFNDYNAMKAIRAPCFVEVSILSFNAIHTVIVVLIASAGAEAKHYQPSRTYQSLEAALQYMSPTVGVCY